MSDNSDRFPEPASNRPHMVLLGAGASLAALPNGDKCGRQLPLMNNLIEVLSLGPLLDKCGIPHNGVNFEALYSGLIMSGQNPDIVQAIEASVFDYFHGMRLPDSPTIYDHLVLSLRPKDYIASFNWDPFLLQAIERNYSALKTKPPHFCHLHGCVALSYCDLHKPMKVQRAGPPCRCCGGTTTATRLLYPVTQKKYNVDPYSAAGWHDVQMTLKNAYLLTIFGYGAPSTDVEAVSLLKQAWGDPTTRQFEEIEIIDIRNEDDLHTTWEPFIHTHHYEIHQSFNDSLIARFPRRSCEGFWNMSMQCINEKDYRAPRNLDFPDLWAWHQQLIEAEAV